MHTNMSSRILGAAALSAVAALTLATPAHAAPMPTVVLVHGAFADESSWNGVVADLSARGYKVVNADNPLRGPSYDAASVRAVIDSINGPVILVGHSYGGVVITNAATGADNVEALVYVAGMVPDRGEPAISTINPLRYPEGRLLPPVLLPTVAPDTTNPVGYNLDVYVNPQFFREVFAADLPAETAATMAAKQQSLALAANLEPSGEPAWRALPSWSVIPRQDLTVPTRAQRDMAARAGSTVTEVDASHAVLVSQPGVVAQVIATADAAT